jgi:Tfp pilus assembly protein PilX
MNMHTIRPLLQRGSTLLISLIMLAVLALFAVSSIRGSLVNLRIAGNSQYQLEAQMAAQRAIDDFVSSLDSFANPRTVNLVYSTTANTGIDATGGGNAYNVTVAPPKCVYIKAVAGYSYSLAGQAPKDTTWRITSTATDVGSGAVLVINQGVKVVLPATATCY